MSKQLIILAGGLGTRLKARLGDLPKPMIPICGKPLLEHQVELAVRHGFKRIALFVCYRPERIQEVLGDGSRWGAHLEYLVESQPMGTAGAVLAGWDHLQDRFLVLYGDTLVNVDLHRIWEFHQRKSAAGTLLLHPNNHPLDSDLVECDSEGRITAFHNRPHPAGAWFQNLVNAGLYVLERRALEPFRHLVQGTTPKSIDFGKDVFPAMLRSGEKLLGYSSPEYIKDIGTPERYDKVCEEVRLGVVERSSFSHSAPAVFIDRDGTLIEDVDGLKSPDQLRLLPGVSEAIQSFNRAGFRVVVVTNQPVIAKGFVTEEGLQVIHNKLETLLGMEHAFVDRIYYCPHHPERGFPGERVELKRECDCRKPRPGMILQAAQDLNLDLGRSFMIGDTTTDLQCARNAGVRSILVQTGYAGQDRKFDVQPDYTFATLADAARFLTQTQAPTAKT